MLHNHRFGIQSFQSWESDHSHTICAPFFLIRGGLSGFISLGRRKKKQRCLGRREGDWCRQLPGNKSDPKAKGIKGACITSAWSPNMAPAWCRGYVPKLFVVGWWHTSNISINNKMNFNIFSSHRIPVFLVEMLQNACLKLMQDPLLDATSENLPRNHHPGGGPWRHVPFHRVPSLIGFLFSHIGRKKRVVLAKNSWHLFGHFCWLAAKNWMTWSPLFGCWSCAKRM